MRAFWAVLAALLVSGCVYMFVAARTNARAAAVSAYLANEQQIQAGLDAEAAAAKARQDQQQAAAAKSAAELEALTKKQQELAATLEATKLEAARLQKLAESPSKAPDAAPVTPAPAEAPKADAPKPDGYSISGGSIAPVGVTGAPTTDANKPVVATVKQDKPLTFQGFEVIPAKIEKKDDGSMLVDGQYLIKGEGTTEKPYLVPWDVLTSVEETFDPQAGKKKLPERITMLDGKVVKLSGYVAFPLMMKEAKECLSMLNQWDGCCIGVPPTPYDAVEVSLTRVIKGEERFTTSGHVTGTFKVKPYLQGDWLIGLYVMDQSDLKSRDYGGAAGT
jgi:hypothetical protein